MKKNNPKSIILIVSLSLLLVFFLLSPVFEIKEVRVNDNSRQHSIIKESKIQLGSNIFLLNTFACKKRILKSDRQIEDVKIKRILPSTLEIRVKLKEPIMLILSDDLYGLTRACELIKIEPHFVPNLPIFTGYNISTPYTFLPDSISKPLVALYDAISSGYPNLLYDISEIHFDSQAGLGFYIISKDIFVTVGLKDFELKLVRLEKILGELEYVNEKPVYIDLDFKSQAIVRFQSKKERDKWRM